MVDKPLTSEEVKKIAGKDINVVTYNELKNYDKLDDIFRNSGCLILYETHDVGVDKKSGHWTIVYKNGKNKVTYFDSYGNFIDQPLDIIDKSFSKRIGQYYPILSKLLYESPYEIHYNNYPLQSKDPLIATCGRYAGLAYRNRYMDIDQFVDVFKKYKNRGYNLDEIIVGLTDKYI